MNPDELMAQLAAAHLNGDDAGVARLTAIMRAHPDFTMGDTVTPAQLAQQGQAYVPPDLSNIGDPPAGTPYVPRTPAQQAQDAANIAKIVNTQQPALRGTLPTGITGGDVVTPAQLAQQGQPYKAPDLSQLRDQQTAPGVIKLDRSGTADTGEAPPVTTLNRVVDDTQAPPPPDGTTGGYMDSVNALLQPFAKNVTLGLAPKAEAGIASLVYGVPYSEAAAAQERNYNALAAQHPYLNAAGNVAGFVEGGRALGAVLPGQLAPVAGQGARNFLKAAGVGSAIGGETSLVDSLGHDETTGQRLTNAGISALAGGTIGPVVGELGSAAVKAAGPYVSRAVNAVTGGAAGSDISGGLSKGWRYLANKLGIPADQLAAHIAQNQAQGVPTTVQGVMNARDSGVLAGFAEKNPEAATILQGGRQAAQEASPADMAAAIEANIPTARPQLVQNVANHQQSKFSLSNALDDNMDALMAPIRAQPAVLNPELIGNPLINRLAPRIGDVNPTTGQPGVPLREKLQQAANAQPTPQNPNPPPVTDPINLGDLEKVRRQLRIMQGGSGPDAIEAGHTADALEHVIGQQSPEYTAALQHYGDAAKYIQGFAHGQAGQPISVAQEASLRAALRTPEGQQGHAAGTFIGARDQARQGADSAVKIAQQLSRNTADNAAMTAANPAGAAAVNDAAARVAARARATAQSTPASIRVADEGGVGELANGAAQGVMGAHYSMIHQLGRAVGNFMSKNTFSPDVQREIASGLTSLDPAVIRQTLMRLQQGGVDNQSLRTLVQQMSGVASYAGNNLLDSGNAQ